MAKLIGATLLLIVLVTCFSDRTVYGDEFTSVSSKAEIRKCRCSVMEFGKRKRCPKQLIPTRHLEKEVLRNCLCCEVKNHTDRTPELTAFCNFPCYFSTPL